MSQRDLALYSIGSHKRLSLWLSQAPLLLFNFLLIYCPFFHWSGCNVDHCYKTNLRKGFIRKKILLLTAELCCKWLCPLWKIKPNFGYWKIRFRTKKQNCGTDKLLCKSETSDFKITYRVVTVPLIYSVLTQQKERKKSLLEIKTPAFWPSSKNVD